MTWRRLLFWIVYLLTWVPLFVLLFLGYVGEGVREQVERLERWSERTKP